MVAGIDRYYQIVKCFRDEELRADRQPEFTQIDCEMSFVNQQDIIDTFEPLIRYIFKETLNIVLPDIFPHMTYADAMNFYGCDKPDTRFDMRIHDITPIVKGTGFALFDDAEYIGCIAASMAVSQSKMKELTTLAKSPEIGSNRLFCINHTADGYKSSIKLANTIFQNVAEAVHSNPGDCIMLFAGPKQATLVALGRFRLAIASQLKLRDPNQFSVLWVVDFPLLERNEEKGKWDACHHPFTSAKPEDIPLFAIQPGSVRAQAYDLVINGTEVGGGSIRMHTREDQLRTLKILGFTEEEAEQQFGFLIKAFEYGAPPHGGLAFGFDRLCTIIAKEESIRSVIAFPKNKDGRDTMIEAPSPISIEQLKELYLDVVKTQT
jgi:aspartyl-tRNA synthetase